MIICDIIFAFTFVFAVNASFLLENCEMLDLSHSYNNKTIYWPGAGAFHLTTVFKGYTKKGYWYEANNISTPEHGGTHLDAPAHFARGAEHTAQVKISQLVGEACVINITQKCYQNADYQLSINDVMNWEKSNGRLDPSCILLVKTGWEIFWPDKMKYLGTAGTNISYLHFPGVHPNTTRWLAANRKIKALGLDSASTDYGQSQFFETHQVLGAHNIPGFENLKNLKDLPARGATVVFLPMKIEGGSGGPLRGMAYGWKGQNDPCRRDTNTIFPSFSLTILGLLLFLWQTAVCS